jgi:phosphotransferase family enzyme
MAETQRTSAAATPDACQHPAVQAWFAAAGAAVVERVESLRQGRHCRVDRLVMGGAHPRHSVIAKWQDRPFGFEKRVQEEILPSVGLPSLTVYGEWVTPAADAFWIFFEDVGDECFQPSIADRHLVARWLAMLHDWKWQPGDANALPDRGPAGYLDHLRSTHRTMAACIGEPRLEGASRSALVDLLHQLDALELAWPDIESRCAAAPLTLVHGDLAGKNARVRQRAAERELLVFDWEMAGIGVPCVDLAQETFGSLSPDLDAYGRQARRWCPIPRLEELERLAAVGKVFRLLAALDWEARSLPHSWCDGREFWPFPSWFRDARIAAGL